MGTPILLVAAILTLAVLYVLLPVMVETFVRFRGVRNVECPESHHRATVAVDARHAAMTSAFGRPKLRLVACSDWPEKEGCAQECLKQVY